MDLDVQQAPAHHRWLVQADLVFDVLVGRVASASPRAVHLRLHDELFWVHD